jgi:PEP-CTERM motif
MNTRVSTWFARRHAEVTLAMRFGESAAFRRTINGKLFLRRFAAFCAVSLVTAISAPKGFADPVRVVTSGDVFQLFDDGETGALLVGQGFSIAAGDLKFTPALPCELCVPGTKLSIAATAQIQAIPAGLADVDGETFDTVFLSGTLHFDAASLVVPDIPLDGPPALLSEPFSFTGNVAGFADESRTGVPLFALQLVGRGTATVELFNFTRTGIFLESLGFDFAPATATPEPASILLLLSGGAGLFARRRRRSTTAWESNLMPGVMR